MARLVLTLVRTGVCLRTGLGNVIVSLYMFSAVYSKQALQERQKQTKAKKNSLLTSFVYPVPPLISNY